MVTEQVLFIQMPHTGSGAVHEVLLRTKGLNIIDVVAHQSYKYSVEKCVEAGYIVPPAFAFVRNPWLWNVSMWTWAYHVCGNRRGFAKTGRTFMDFLEFRRKFEEGREYEGIYDGVFSGMQGAWRNLGGDEVQFIGRTETIFEDGPRILSTVMPHLVSFGWAKEQFLDIGLLNEVNQPGTNHFHGPYQTFYTPETRGWIAKWEAEIIDRFGYTFEGGPRG